MTTALANYPTTTQVQNTLANYVLKDHVHDQYAVVEKVDAALAIIDTAVTNHEGRIKTLDDAAAVEVYTKEEADKIFASAEEVNTELAKINENFSKAAGVLDNHETRI